MAESISVFSCGRHLASMTPRTLASRAIRSRGVISTSPRLPTMATRPRSASSLRSLPRLTLASISTMTLTPAPPVASATAVCSAAKSLWETARSAPKERTTSMPASVPAVPMMRSPRATPNCTDARPTAPDAPLMSTHSPGLASATWKSARYAVRYGTPIAAPWRKSTDGGSRCTADCTAFVASAYVPEMEPLTYTRSPGAQRVTPAPMARTTPAPSLPGVYGGVGAFA
mmetsp:Transcript_1835/g.5798  ORF Transcript_1835/g.5798 Transcript_1835/m.5798 type:complete len:229 (-) Transcript_1835:360-1046(-)